jgi:1-aminocyclopropane-1-carboxylate synthase
MFSARPLLISRYFDPAEEVLPEQIITGVGCSAGMSTCPSALILVLDQLFYTLMDEGEAILLAAP